MITFSQRLQIEKNKRQIQQLLVAMETHGLNPHSFVDWLVIDGVSEFQNGRFNEAAKQFLENEILIAEAWSDYAKAALKGAGTGAAVGLLGGGAGALGGAAIGAGVGALGQLAKDTWHSDALSGIRRGLSRWISPDSASTPSPTSSSSSSSSSSPLPKPAPSSTPITSPKAVSSDLQDHAKEAVVAMSNLSKRIQQSAALQDMLGGKAQASTFTATLANLINSIQTKLTESLYVPSSNIIFEQIEDFRQELSVRNALYDLEDIGINPENFVDWFIEGEYFFQENYNENIGDWWSQFKANVEDAWKNWGKAGETKQAEIDKERDMRAINNAIQKLSNLESQIKSGGHKAAADFVRFVDEFKKMLHPIVGLSVPPIDPAVVEENKRIDIATRWLKLGNIKSTNIPSKDVLLKLYDKATQFTATKKADVAQKKIWWTHIADALNNGEDPIKAADNFDVLHPDDQTKIQLTKTYLSNNGLDSKLLPNDEEALKIFAKSEKYRIDNRKNLTAMIDWWKDIAEKIKNGIDPLEEKIPETEPKADDDKPEVAPKTDDDKPEVAPMVDEKTQFVNDLFSQGKIPPMLNKVVVSKNYDSIPSVQKSYIAILEALEKLHKNQPVEIWGNEINEFDDLYSIPHADEKNLEWLQEYLINHQNDSNKAKEELNKSFEAVKDKIGYKESEVESDSYIPSGDYDFYESIIGNRKNKSAGWFNY